MDELMKHAITINIYYSDSNGGAKAFAEEMTVSGIVERIRAKEVPGGKTGNGR